MNLRPYIATLIVASFVTSPFIAAADATSTVISVDTTSQQILINQLEAQLASLKAQLAYLLSLRANASSSTPAAVSAAPNGNFCVSLSRTLSIGMQGDDVTLLQKALATDATIYPTGMVTGYFGSATQAAVMNLQTRYNILVDGVATGVVGSQTRAFFAAQCSKTSVGTANGTTSSAPLANGGNTLLSNIFGNTGTTSNPITSLTPTPQVLTDVFRWVVASPATTTPGASIPTVVSFNGPTHLSTNQIGTWNINATDPKGESLTYAVTWGDATSSAASSLLALAGGSAVETSTIPSFQHSYATAAVYPVSVAIQNTEGVTVTASALVLVSNPGVNSVSSVLQEISNSSSTYTDLLNELSAIPTSTTSNTSSSTNPWIDTTSWLTDGTFCSMFPSLCTYLGTSTVQSTLQNNNPYANIGSTDAGAGNTGAGNTTGLPGYAQTVGQSCSPSGTFTAVWAAPGLLVSSSSGKDATSTGSIIQLQCTGGHWVDPLASAPGM